MCQAPVGKVIRVEGNTATIKYNGQTRKIKCPKQLRLSVGDYVTFSLDIAIDKIDAEEAEMILGQMK